MLPPYGHNYHWGKSTMIKCTNTPQIVITLFEGAAGGDRKQSSPILTQYDTEFFRRSESNK